MKRRITGLSDIAAEFDGFLIDQFGVLHDGNAPFPGAIAAFEALAATGKPIVALTNSGKRSAPNTARLARLGFAKRHLAGVISSGELVYRDLRDWLASGKLHAKARVTVLSRDGKDSPIADLDLIEADPGPDTDLLLIAGSSPETHSAADYARMLAPLAARRTPAICVNPDRVIYAEGGPADGPGVIAENYARAAGVEVKIYGKPALPMFTAGLAALGHPPPQKVLMIGDSAEHDIAGAAKAGCKTLLIRGGVQGSVSATAAPDYEIDRLIW